MGRSNVLHLPRYPTTGFHPWSSLSTNKVTVSVTYVVRQLTAMILRGVTLNHLQPTAALSGAQHGFIPHRSYISNFLVAEAWTTRLVIPDKGVDLVYLDFANAFDTAYHGKPYEKMHIDGIYRSIVGRTRSTEGPFFII